MHPSQDFNRLYTSISESIATAIGDIADLDVEHKDGKRELDNMMEKLRAIQVRFDHELVDLQKYAEWDKFTIAFFGETNAGKSTVIESLRILFNEESRRQLLHDNAQDVERFEQAFAEHVNHVRASLSNAYREYAAEIAEIRQSTAALASVLRDESSARIRRKLWLFVIGGVLAGGALAVPLTLLTRGLL
ncbi:hypothetical protein [Ralstonia insidiosa]|uniref:G domain-containing protein n=1 Tax=Ralstonia insidiosa TaxID=190721 RepID=A0A848NRY6_9RALS|nr:hypothetical protein [Ralstonia insidiosa]NMV37871.1 hypothetical protein [Ralstonia insidiosa]